MELRFSKLCAEAKAPKRMREGDAGYDLTCVSTEETKNGVLTVHTGIAVEIPQGYFGLLLNRSSIKDRHLIPMAGVIDSNYRGEICFCVYKAWLDSKPYAEGERCAQLIILPSIDVDFIEVDQRQLTQTDRGTNGFGSSGN